MVGFLLRRPPAEGRGLAAQVPKAPAPTKSLQHKPAGAAADSLFPDIFGAGTQAGRTSFLSDLFATAPIAGAPAQVCPTVSPTMSLHCPAAL